MKILMGVTLLIFAVQGRGDTRVLDMNPEITGSVQETYSQEFTSQDVNFDERQEQEEQVVGSDLSYEEAQDIYQDEVYDENVY